MDLFLNTFGTYLHCSGELFIIKVPDTAEAKAHNKALSTRRILIENINRLCKMLYQRGLSW
jgi:hypothetical protein